MPLSDPVEHRLASSYGGYLSWSKPQDRAARNRPGHLAAEQRFVDLADGDLQAAAALRRAHFQKMALLSVQARRRAAVTDPPTSQPTHATPSGPCFRSAPAPN